MKDRVKWGAAGLVLGLAVALSLPSFADTTPSSSNRTVTVTGTSTIKSKPDEAIVSLGVETTARTAEAAMRDNAAKMNEVMVALRDQGIAADDIATAYIQLYPRYDDSGRNITGYSASNSINVTVRDMSKVGTVIDRAVGAGANVAGGITFQLSDQSQGREQALQAAVADARTQADALAQASGASVGQVMRIDAVNAPAPPPVYYDRVEAAAGASTPVSPPTLETQVTVTVTWALA
jgi:hypothetical protein